MPPISPNDANLAKTASIPEDVFDAFNTLIGQNWNGQCATVYQDDVLDAIQQAGYTADEIFNKKWMDVEPSYRDAGWKVSYDSPIGYAGESFKSYFKFSKP